MENKKKLFILGWVILFGIALSFTNFANPEYLDCMKKGWKREKQGKFQGEMCVMHYEDGWKICNASSECLGDCIVTKMDDTAGECAMTDSHFGCKQTIEKFKAGEGILCVD